MCAITQASITQRFLAQSAGKIADAAPVQHLHSHCEKALPQARMLVHHN
jgi:hypothetical protein